jgi:hypothetical protein
VRRASLMPARAGVGSVTVPHYLQPWEGPSRCASTAAWSLVRRTARRPAARVTRG